MLFVRVWPEQGRHTLTRNPPATSGRKNRKYRKPRRPQPWRGRRVIRFEAEASEREEAQHLDLTLACRAPSVKPPWMRRDDAVMTAARRGR